MENIFNKIFFIKEAYAKGILEDWASGNPPEKEDLITVVVSITDVMLGAAVMVAVCMLCYVAFLLFTSNADPNKIQKARQVTTLTVIGLTLIVMSNAIASTFTGILHNTAGTATDAEDLIINLLESFIYPLMGFFAFFGLVWGGVLFITSGGDEARVAQARKMLLWSVIGALLLILSYGLIVWFVDFLPTLT